MQDPLLRSFSQEDWNLFIGRAEAQGVAPLIYWELSRSGELSSLPGRVHRALRSIYLRTWMQNQKLIGELEELARLFDQAEIPVVVIKGACFALTIYADASLRPMGDLDLLVPRQKLSEAVQIAKSSGYMESIPEASPGLNDLLNHAVFMQKGGGQSMPLELHKSLVADRSFTYAVPVEWFWSQTEPLDGAAQSRFRNLRMLTPTAQVLYASAHAMLQHGGRKAPLRWYCDLDRLVRYYDRRIDWGLLLSQARVFEWNSAVEAALSQTRAFFDTPIPDHVLDSLSESPDRHRKLVGLLQKQPATRVLEENQKLAGLTWYGRLRLVMALVAPSPAYMRWRYQLRAPGLLPAYYLIRWWGILIDGFRTLGTLLKEKFSVIWRDAGHGDANESHIIN